MPGSYPDPQSYANTALQALEDAYEDSHDSQTGSLILTAIEAIKRLKQEIKNMGNADELAGYDPYELNEHNSAL
jgi:hypothetical protein